MDRDGVPRRRPAAAGAAMQGSASAAPTRAEMALRMIGALAVFVTAAIHIQQFFAVYIRVVPVIGPLFALNFAGGVGLGVLLLAPTGRLVDRLLGRGGRAVLALLAIGGIFLAALSIAFLLASEFGTIFGFHEHGYRLAIKIALAAEAAVILSLGSYLARLGRRG